MGKIKAYFRSHKLAAEIFRFIIVGGFATVIDMFVMGVVMYAFQPEIYPHFYDVFFNSDIKPSSISTVIGTGSGFIAGLIFNYFLSVFFVFEEKGESKTVKGFLLFTVFSAIGLFIHVGGMYVFYTLLHVNEWIVKILLTIVVLVYNFITRKTIIFKDKNKGNDKRTEGEQIGKE